MSNQSFIAEYSDRLGESLSEKRHQNLLFSQWILYSYGWHYPLLWEVKGIVFCNISWYSSTTWKHVSYANRHAHHWVNLYMNLRDWDTMEARTITALRAEREQLKDKIKKLSKRAWKQKEIAEYRLERVIYALDDLDVE